MPEVARKSAVDLVASPDGNPGTPCDPPKVICDVPSTQATAAGSSDVFIEGIGVVRENDAMISHPAPVCGCAPHAPVLTSFSSRVYANGLRIGRIGDDYSAHVIITGAATVIDGSSQAQTS
jgi:uncharacterized Zn-binding protein involved in type VI secretion